VLTKGLTHIFFDVPTSSFGSHTFVGKQTPSTASKVMCMLYSISESQGEDSMPMCLSNSQLESQDVHSMSMSRRCVSRTHTVMLSMMGTPC
jgi:hypothetical protein